MDQELNTEVAQPDVAQESAASAEKQEITNEPASMLDAIAEGLKQPEAQEPDEAKPDSVEPKPDESQEPTPEDDETPPEGITKKAQERFQRLVTRVKEKDEEITHLRSNLDGIRKVMQDTKAAPEDFAMVFDYLKALRSGNMDQVGKMLQEQIRQYQIATGKSFGAVDPLAEYPDLREKVNAYQITEDSALEVARMRAMQRENQIALEQRNQRQESANSAMQAKNGAIDEINRLGVEWAKKDPDYAAKEEIILKQIPEIARNFPPHAWAGQVRMLYQALSSVPLARPAAAAPAPLRASGQTAGARQPNNMLEALQQGLGYGNG
jgi:hypothetical protein